MALIKCNECSKEISDQAAACPSCGAPVAQASGNNIQTAAPIKSKTSTATWVALVLIVLGGVWFVQSREFKEQSLPPLPIEVGIREAMLGSGKVLQIKNNSGDTLMVVTSFSNQTTKQQHAFRLDIPAGSTSEIGHLEGWVVASGDVIEIRNDAYQTWKGNAP